MLRQRKRKRNVARKAARATHWERVHYTAQYIPALTVPSTGYAALPFRPRENPTVLGVSDRIRLPPVRPLP